MGEGPMAALPLPDRVLMGRGPMAALPLPDRVLMGRGPMAALPLPDRVLMGRAPWQLAAETPYSPASKASARPVGRHLFSKDMDTLRERSECPTEGRLDFRLT
ncbi:hypothetical protein DSO57_1002020 [Entomophthora muscae]|uniref:Uncharacterized protein n=1 Tax=Entomophthora muscae TaxID=34485 RepID=A0ACC2RNV3_9FUNG|nr:hypothetical protein DSO57_1002020 [Entomophthora muscae]